MKNDEWSVKVAIDKIDSETKQRIKGDTEFKIYEWDTVLQRYIPAGGYNQYAVERQPDGTYKVINHSAMPTVRITSTILSATRAVLWLWRAVPPVATMATGRM